MKIAIMQPYIFPYVGYFQLVKSVDLFVLYDDVNFIKQGWINRNKILVAGKEFVFTIPLKDASSFTTIRETQINSQLFIKWKVKFLRTLEQSYKRAPYFIEVYRLTEKILNKDFTSIADFANESIIKISELLGLKTSFACSSFDYSDTKLLDRENRLIEIVKTNNATNYINPIGGQELYSKESFVLNKLQLNFLKAKLTSYKQFDNEFVSGLSIIDVLMFNNPEEVNVMLDKFELV